MPATFFHGGSVRYPSATFTRTISRSKSASRENVAAIQHAMWALELAGWGRLDGIREVGRRVTAWAINPTRTKFAARAKAERERREARRNSPDFLTRRHPISIAVFDSVDLCRPATGTLEGKILEINVI